MSKYVGRLAPSPTGALHLGNVRTFMIAWLRARSQGGEVILRMEDLDHPKDKPGADIQAIEDLRWLGFDWDREYVQSQRKHLYHEALEALHAQGLVYPCVCSRRDVEAAQSAPHAGEQLYYPGTCRGRFASWAEAQAFLDGARMPCWRFKVPAGTVIAFDDVFAGRYEQDVSRTLGDFPIARDEFGAGYTLACTVDDLLMGVTEVVRGDDLLPATPAQLLLAEALMPFVERFQRRGAEAQGPDAPLHLGVSALRYLHVPLVVGKDGKRLAKRHGDTRIATFREQGRCPEEIIGQLAASCGWARPDERLSLVELLPRIDLATVSPAPFMI